jgi:hypothetical protein
MYLLVAIDAQGQTRYAHGQAKARFVLGLGPEEGETHETRHGAHAGSWTARRSRVSLSAGSSARKVDSAARRGGIQNKYGVWYDGVQAESWTGSSPNSRRCTGACTTTSLLECRRSHCPSSRGRAERLRRIQPGHALFRVGLQTWLVSRGIIQGSGEAVQPKPRL